MDTSDRYIKMCEQAKEIRNKRPLSTGDLVAYRTADNYFYSRVFIAENELIGSKREYIWLPRQDQLQEMIQPFPEISSYELKFGEPLPCFNIKDVIQDFTSFVIDNEIRDSYEQYWLSFIMSKKFNKIWNGEDWIRE